MPDPKISKTLRRVFDNHGPEWRYVPRAIGKGPGWLAWDRVNSRYLNDAEVAKIDPSERLTLQ